MVVVKLVACWAILKYFSNCAHFYTQFPCLLGPINGVNFLFLVWVHHFHFVSILDQKLFVEVWLSKRFYRHQKHYFYSYTSLGGTSKGKNIDLEVWSAHVCHEVGYKLLSLNLVVDYPQIEFSKC